MVKMQVKVFKKVTGLESYAQNDTVTTTMREVGAIAQPVPFDGLWEFARADGLHKRCLTKKATCVAGLGHNWKNEQADKQPLIKQPNERESWSDILIKLQWDLETFANGYLELVRLGGKLSSIYHIPATYMYVGKDRDYVWQIMPDGKKQKFGYYGAKRDEIDEQGRPLHEIIHFCKYSPGNTYYGEVDYTGILDTMAIVKQVKSYNLNFFSNNATPDFALMVEGGDLSEESIKEIEEYLADNFKGVANSHKMLFIPVSDPNVKVKLQPLQTVKEGSFVATKDQGRDEIINVHGIPPRIVGIMTSGSLGGGGEITGQLQVFRDTDCAPSQRWLESRINGLIEKETGLNPELHLHGLDITTDMEDAQRYEILVRNGIMTVDEVRSELGMGALEGENPGELLASLRKIREKIPACAGMTKE